ncbi:MAG: hypothetical protein ACN4GR_17475 [Arenicellales bacterium]
MPAGSNDDNSTEKEWKPLSNFLKGFQNELQKGNDLMTKDADGAHFVLSDCKLDMPLYVRVAEDGVTTEIRTPSITPQPDTKKTITGATEQQKKIDLGDNISDEELLKEHLTRLTLNFKTSFITKAR